MGNGGTSQTIEISKSMIAWLKRPASMKFIEINFYIEEDSIQSVQMAMKEYFAVVVQITSTTRHMQGLLTTNVQSASHSGTKYYCSHFSCY